MSLIAVLQNAAIAGHFSESMLASQIISHYSNAIHAVIIIATNMHADLDIAHYSKMRQH